MIFSFYFFSKASLIIVSACSHVLVEFIGYQEIASAGSQRDMRFGLTMEIRSAALPKTEFLGERNRCRRHFLIVITVSRLDCVKTRFFCFRKETSHLLTSQTDQTMSHDCCRAESFNEMNRLQRGDPIRRIIESFARSEQRIKGLREIMYPALLRLSMSL